MTYMLVRDPEHPEASHLTQFSSVVGTWGCRVPVVPGGDGADALPPEKRTACCLHFTSILIGWVPTCLHHLRMVLPMMMLTEDALRDSLRKNGEPQPIECEPQPQEGE